MHEKLLHEAFCLSLMLSFADFTSGAQDKCQWLSCAAGQICVVDSMKQERCICAETGSCPPGHGMVCGSDGRLYDSHCELHRAACITDTKIYVDKKGEACLQKGLCSFSNSPSYSSI